MVAATASRSALAAELPVVWTTKDLEQWLKTLPASEQAELKWTTPGMRTALGALLTQPLEADVIDAATREIIRVSFGCRRFMNRMLHGRVPLDAIYQMSLERIPDIKSFLESPSSGSHAELALRSVVTVSKDITGLLQQFDEQQKAALEEHISGQELDTLVEQSMAGAWVDIARAQALLSALLEAVQQRGSQERGRELSRLALRYLVRGVAGVRREEVWRGDLGPGEPGQDREDKLLHAAATLVLAGQEDMPRELAWPPLYDTEAAAQSLAESVFVGVKVTPRVRRLMVNVTGVLLAPTPSILLEGWYSWCAATPELVERALALRGQLVRATVLTGLQARVLRIDLASSPPVSDAATRARDMLHDWGELLERLAR